MAIATSKTNAHAHRMPPKPMRHAGLQPIEDNYSTYNGSAQPLYHQTLVYSAVTDRAANARAASACRAANMPVRNSTMPWLSPDDLYDGAELRPFDGRPGAMQAFDYPSRVGGKLFYRDGRVKLVA